MASEETTRNLSTVRYIPVHINNKFAEKTKKKRKKERVKRNDCPCVHIEGPDLRFIASRIYYHYLFI
jgi:hypothetical protein